MASSLLELLTSQQSPHLQTRKALIILDLQHDFVHPDGRLVVNLLNGFQTSFNELVADFRLQGQVIWIRSEFAQQRPLEPDGSAGGDAVILKGDIGAAGEEAIDSSEDSDDELLQDAFNSSLSMGRPSALSSRNKALLQRIAARSRQEPTSSVEPTSGDSNDLFLTNWEPDRQPVSTPEGSKYSPFALALMKPNDINLTKSSYSAFTGTNLLTLLRSNLVTELYLCGSLTNVSVFSTASEAARHGLSITLLDDCLGYRSLPAHSQALKHLIDYCGAQTISSSQLLQDLNASTKHVAGPTHVTHVSTHPSDRQNVREGKLELYSPDDTTSESRNSRSLPAKNTIELSEREVPIKQVAKAQPSPSKVPRSPRNCSPEISRSRDRKKFETPARVLAVSPSSDMNGNESAATREESPTLDSVDQHRTKRSKPTSQGFLGPGDALGEGDSRIVHDAMFDQTLSRALHSHRADALVSILACRGNVETPSRHHRETCREHCILENRTDPSQNIFQEVKNEVHWQKMYHVSGEVPRLVCAQGEVSPDGGIPIYRHPADQSLPLLSFSPAVDAIRKYVEDIVEHPMNHVLIQLYRGGNDYISEHSDKTLDIVHESSIVNVSLGAMRKMRLRTKRPLRSQRPDPSKTPDEEPQRRKQEVQMPHGSTFILGLETNMKWLHSINQDRRRAVERSSEELAYGGERISLTFRNIGTFLSPDNSRIWGQGAVSKDPTRPNRTVNGNEAETTRLVHMFGTENQSTDFNWEDVYGPGSDVLHFSGPASPPEIPLLFLSGNYLSDLPVRIYLKEMDIAYLIAGVLPHEAGTRYHPPIMFRDADSKRTQTQSMRSILLYLERNLAPQEAPCSQTVSAVHLGLALGDRSIEELIRAPDALLETLEQALGEVEGSNESDDEAFLAGSKFGIADAAFFPIVNEIAEMSDDRTICVAGRRLDNVEAWHRRLTNRTSINSVVWSDAEG